MNVHHVALLIFCCVFDLSSAVRIVANQTTENPDDCILSKCPPQPCTRAFFSEKDSTCIFLDCDNNRSCDLFLAELGEKIRKEGPDKKNTSDPVQPPLPSPKSTISLPLTAPPASTTTTAATLSAPVAHPEVKQYSVNSTTPDPRFSNSTSSSSQEGDQGQVQNKKWQNGVLGPGDLKDVVMSSTQNGHPGQVQNMTMQNGHQGQPSVEPPTPAPTSPPVPVASEAAGNISSSMPKEQNGSQMNKTNPTTTTTTTTTATTDTPALPTNSTTANTTTLTVTPTTSTTSKVTSLPSTTQTKPTSTPPPTPPPPPPSSRAPASLSSVTPTPPPGKNPSPTSSRVPDVTSDQDKAIEETAGGELTSQFVNTNSLIAVLIFGLLFLIVTVILFLRHAYESYKRRGYTQMDYLINGMYSDSGL
ncbi:hypothetical protein QTP86_027982 [Hemibagrus guttatus]|nr:hypothetical protein QTP86_027982 [Hemibagrus guttatus]